MGHLEQELMQRLKNGNFDIQDLLDQGVNVNEPDTEYYFAGYTPLMYAVLWSSQSDCIQKLLEAGANPNIIGRNGKIALDGVRDDFNYNETNEIAKLLIEKGSKLSASYFQKLARDLSGQFIEIEVFENALKNGLHLPKAEGLDLNFGFDFNLDLHDNQQRQYVLENLQKFYTAIDWIAGIDNYYQDVKLRAMSSILDLDFMKITDAFFIQNHGRPEGPNLLIKILENINENNQSKFGIIRNDLEHHDAHTARDFFESVSNIPEGQNPWNSNGHLAHEFVQHMSRLGVDMSQDLAYSVGTNFFWPLLHQYSYPPVNIDAPKSYHDAQGVYHEETALMLLARKGDIEAVKELLARGANPNLSFGWDGKTALIYAIDGGNIECFKELLNHSQTDLNVTNQNGRTPLMHAAELGSIQCIEALCEKNVNLDTVDQAGRTALALIPPGNSYADDMKALLISKGAVCNDADMTDNVLKKCIECGVKIEVFYKILKLPNMNYQKLTDLNQNVSYKDNEYVKQTKQIFLQLQKFHKAAVELKYPEDKELDLFGKYLHATTEHPEGIAFMLTAKTKGGMPDDLIPQIIGWDPEVFKIHLKMHNDAVARGTEKTLQKEEAAESVTLQETVMFFADIDELVTKKHGWLGKLDQEAQNKIIHCAEAHVEGPPLSQRNHDFFIEMCKMADPKVDAEEVWTQILQNHDIHGFAEKVEDGIFKYMISHNGDMPD